MDDADWIFASQHFGIHTFYRKETDDSLSIKLEGQLNNVPLFEQVCVLREVDLHYVWAPFCSSSLTVANLDKLDQVGWFMVGMPNFGLARDGCFRAIGCDNIEEDGTIIMAAQGVQDDPTAAAETVEGSGGNGGGDRFLADDAIIQQLDIPPVPKRRGCGRITIHRFEAMIQIQSPTSATTRIVANVNPNINFLPKSLLDFVLKHMAGAMLGKMQAAAIKVSKNPLTNPHAQRMRADSAFYKDWLMAKFQSLCKEKGWEMPPVTVFDYDDDNNAVVAGRESHELLRVRTFSGVLSDSNSTGDNLSTKSTPQPLEEELSEMSSRSGLSNSPRNNPIRQYLAEVRHRTKKKQKAKEEEARRIMAERLKPKELQRHQQERLIELKHARDRRRMQHGEPQGSTPRASNVDYDNGLFSRSASLSERFHSHSYLTRGVVVSVLVMLLFAMLHPVSVLRLPPLVTAPTTSLVRLLLDDVLVVTYIAACGVVHYALCDIALVYAFSSLDLGQKAGPQMKSYYGANVRATMAGCSLVLVAVSVVKAWFRVLARSVLWLPLQILPSMKQLAGVWVPTTFSSFPSTFRLVLEGAAFVYAFVIGGTVAWIKWLIHSLLQMLLAVFLRSHFVGRGFEAVVGHFYTTIVGLFIGGTESHGMVGQVPRLSWREEAFDTARTLLTNSAVFLLLLLAVFFLSARLSNPTQAVKVNSNIPTSTAAAASAPMFHRPSNTNSVTASEENRENVVSGRPRASTAYESIPEDEVFSVETPRVGDVERENNDDDVSASNSRKWALGPRRRRAWTAPDGRGRLRKAATC